MQILIKAIVGLAALGFILAAVGSLTGFKPMGITPEAFSLGCTNLALLGIAFSLVLRDA